MQEKAYIDFLRWCINPSKIIPSCSAIINWHDLLAFAKKQTVVGIYWQGIQRLRDIANKPSEDDVMEWMGEYQKIVRSNAKMNDAVVSLVNLMHRNNISFFIFKGQTVATFYANPDMRTSGDIDFYVFSKDRKKAIDLLYKKVNLEEDYTGQHWEFSYHDVSYELHYHTALFALKSRQLYWDELIESYFEEVLDHVVINEVDVPTLPPTLNAIYLFVHIYHHFLKEGIALRQFIDWMMFFEAKHDEIVVSELTAKLERLGLLRAFRAFGAVLTEVLGMEIKFFPCQLTDNNKKYVGRIQSIVLRYGNFGKYCRKEQQGGWKHSIETGLRSIRHITQFFWLSPAENLLWIPKLTIRSIDKNRH